MTHFFPEPVNNIVSRIIRISNVRIKEKENAIVRIRAGAADFIFYG